MQCNPPESQTTSQFEERRKAYACYVCMAKFTNFKELDDHKLSHETDAEDDLFEEEFASSKESASLDNEQKTDSNITAPVVVKPPGKKRGRKKKYVDAAAVSNTCDDKVVKTDTQSTISDGKPITPIKCDNVETSFKCDTCNVFFETSDDAKKHISATKCKFSCRKCSRKFNTLYAFVVHVMQHNSDAGKGQRPNQSNYPCKTCDKSFDDCFQLKRHEVLMHQRRTLYSNYQSTPKIQPDNSKTDGPYNENFGTKETEVSIQLSNREITCETCYDVFGSKEDLENHMEFHRQLERITEVVTPEVNLNENKPKNPTQEVVEDKSDKHDSVASPRMTKHKTSNKLFKKKTIPFQFKTNLTDKIKEMLKPNSEKVSKTILLANPVVAEPKGKRNVVKSKTTASTEVKKSVSSISKTSQVSDSNCENKNDNSALPATTAAPILSTLMNNVILSALLTTSANNSSTSNSTTNSVASISTQSTVVQTSVTPVITQPTITSVTTPTASCVNPQPSINLSHPSTKFAYVIIPHQQPADSLSRILPINRAIISALGGGIVSQNTENNSSNVNDNVTIPLITNVTSLNETFPSEKEYDRDPLAMDNMSDVPSNVQYQNSTLSTPSITAPVTSSISTSISSSIPSTSTENPEIVLIESSSDEEFREEYTKTNKDNESDVEGDLIIDENITNETIEMQGEEKGCTSDKPLDPMQSDPVKPESGARGGGIFVRKLEDLIDPKKVKKEKKKKEKLRFPMKCDGCSVVFNRFRTYRLHNQRKHVCSQTNCKFTCCRTSDLKSHYSLTHNLYYCWRCKFFCNTVKEFRDHTKSHTCPKCEGIYEDLKAHDCKQKLSIKKKTRIIS